MIYFIYRWADGRISSPILATKYIGITINPNKRINEHLKCEGGNLEKDKWIRELNSLGIKPIIEIIDIIYDDRKYALEREKYWIQHYINQGCQLFNIKSVPQQSLGEFKKFVSNLVIPTYGDELKREETWNIVSNCLVAKQASQIIPGDYISCGSYQPYKIYDVQHKFGRTIIYYVDGWGIKKSRRHDSKEALEVIDGAKYEHQLQVYQ
jgi:hypothetical protein